MRQHIPVLLRETIEALAVKPGGMYVDGTLGRAGHTAEILKRGGRVLGIDRDAQALADVAEAVATGANDVPWAALTVRAGRHGALAAIAAAAGVAAADGVLLDLGVSSPQLDDAARGFSFRQDGPLDMRMDRTQALTAAEVVNTYDAAALAEIFRTLGEEPQARRLAQEIVRARASAPFETTGQLAEFMACTLGRHGAHHPATRAFQALRMHVNDEIGELMRALEGALGLLKVGGRLAVITFESLTDRRVKHFFAAHAGRDVSLQAGGVRWEGALPRVKLVTRRAVTAAPDEVDLNARSRSAKLRVAERVGT